MTSGNDDHRTLLLCFHSEDKELHSLIEGIILVLNLLLSRKCSFCTSDVNKYETIIGSLDDSACQLTDLIRELGLDTVIFCITKFLADCSLSSTSCQTSERLYIDRHLDGVALFQIRVDLFCLSKGDLCLRVSNLRNNFYDFIDVHITGLTIDLGKNLLVLLRIRELSLKCRYDCFLDCLEEYFLIDASFFCQCVDRLQQFFVFHKLSPLSRFVAKIKTLVFSVPY